MQEKLLTSTYGKFSHDEITKQMWEMVGDDDLRSKIEDIPPEDWQLILDIHKLIRK